MGLPVPQERVANALVDCVDRGSIGHRAIVSEEGAAPVRMTGNGHQQSLGVFLQATAFGCISSLSPDGRLDGAARQPECTHQRSFVSACD